MEISWLQSNNVGKKCVNIMLDKVSMCAGVFADTETENVLLTTNGLVENSAWGTEMEWTTGWIDVTAFTQVRQILDFVSGKKTFENNSINFWLRTTHPLANRHVHSVGAT